MKNHLALLGDSILDNQRYVASDEPALIDQTRQAMPGWQVDLIAVDGDTTQDVHHQRQRLPDAVTHLVLSVGGNDALSCMPGILFTPVASIMDTLDWLTEIRRKFRQDYRTTLESLLALQKPIIVCTIYEQIPGLEDGLRTALALFNEIILGEAAAHAVPVLDLRWICREPEDFSGVSPIEPSATGGSKIASRIAAALANHDFTVPYCHIYT